MMELLCVIAVAVTVTALWLFGGMYVANKVWERRALKSPTPPPASEATKGQP